MLTAGRLARSLENGDVFSDEAFSRVLSVSYIFSFGLMFLIPARFWDDLNIFNNPDVIGMFERSGVNPAGPLLKFLISLPHPDLIARSFVFAGFFVSALLLRNFLIVLKFTESRVTNAIVVLTAVLPLFQSRFQIITVYYCLSLFLFCAASLFLAQAILQRRPWLRILSYLLLFLSFYIQSFLAFYGFTLLLIALALPSETNESSLIKTFVMRALRIVRMAPEAIALPFLFVALKTWLAPTTGEFIDFNAVTFDRIGSALINLPRTAFDAIIDIPGDGPSWILFAGIMMVGILALPSLRHREPAASAHTPTNAAVGTSLFVSCIGVLFAVFPYSVVRHAVVPFDFFDRNQLTLLLVAGSFAVFFVRLFVTSRMQWVLLYGMLLWAVTANICTYWAIIRDGHVQNAVVQELALNSAVKNNTAFLVDTRDWPDLARHRTLSTAQLNCLLKQAYGDESRFAAEYTQIPFDWDTERAFINFYRNDGMCFRAYRGGAPLLLAIHVAAPLGFLRAAKLSALYIFAPQRYENHLGDLITLSLSSIPDDWIVLRKNTKS